MIEFIMAETKCNVCEKDLILDEENVCAHCELSNNGTNIETPNNVNCGTCKIIVEENSEGLYCDVCNKWFHNACCEKPLMEYLYCLLNEAPNNVKWFCDECIWETEKWIRSVNGEFKVGNESDIHEQVISDNAIESNIDNQVKNISIKVRKRDRPRRLNAVEDNCKTAPEYDATKEPDIKIESQNYDLPFGFDDIQSTDSEDYEEKNIAKKKRKLGSKNKQKRNNKRSYCDLCSKGFLKSENLVAHKLTHSGDKKPFKCTLCDRSFARKSQLKPHHLATHSVDNPFICEICAKSFKWESSFNRHLQEVHSEDKPHQCPLCDYKAAKKSNIDVHMVKHSNNKPFPCTECDLSFKTPYALKQHIVTHSSVKPYACLECGKAFTTAAALRAHMYTHTGDWPFKCTECEAKFAEKIRLTKHMMIHTGERPYPCTMCDYKAIQKSALKRHMQGHSGVKPFVCDVCGKQVSDAQSLKLHALTHTGEKPLKCDVCGKQFRAPGGLRVHMMYHNKIRKHFCHLCGYGSITPGELKSHIASVHSNETPYECDMCGNKYKTKGNLSKHKRGVRGSCQGVNSGNFSKHPPLAKNPKKEHKPELTPLSGQESDANRFTLKSTTQQAHIKSTFKAFSEQALNKAKGTISQHHYQEPTSSMQSISVPQSYHNPLIYTGVTHNNSQYQGIFINPGP